MLVAERKDLKMVKQLVATSEFELRLYENSKGLLFLSCTCSKPEGVVYFATTPSVLCRFIENQINVQTLFKYSHSRFVEITTGEKTALYSLSDILIELKYGDKNLAQISENPPIEIW